MAPIKSIVLCAIALAPALALPGSKASASCAQPTVPTYQACGGFVVDPKPCPKVRRNIAFLDRHEVTPAAEKIPCIGTDKRKSS